VKGAAGLVAAAYWVSAGTVAVAEYGPAAVYVFVTVYLPELSVVAAKVSFVVSGLVTVTVTGMLGRGTGGVA